MIALVEAHQSWLETITYQMCNMPYSQQSKHLGGPIGLLKMSCTRMAHEIADESVQIWGGRGLTQSGMGRTIENFNRGYKFDAILVSFLPVFIPVPLFSPLKKKERKKEIHEHVRNCTLTHW